MDMMLALYMAVCIEVRAATALRQWQRLNLCLCENAQRWRQMQAAFANEMQGTKRGRVTMNCSCVESSIPTLKAG
jgi:hypothetical protein